MTIVDLSIIAIMAVGFILAFIFLTGLKDIRKDDEDEE